MPEASPRVLPVQAEVVPLGRVNQVACAVAAAHIKALLGLSSQVVQAAPEPDFAYLPVRGQHDAAALMDYLAKRRPSGVIRVGVTEADLCLPVFTFVFGEARLGGGVAVASLHRLWEGRYGRSAPRSLAYRRLAKVVCHETGHALGLEHCQELGCLMRFAGGLTTLDRLKMWFCPACAGELSARRAEPFSV